MFDSINNFDEKFSLKDNIPADYDVSEMFYTFEFIYLVYKRNSSIDKAVEAIAFEYGLSAEYIRNFLTENHYIINKTNKREYQNQLKKYNTKALKKILKKNKIKTSGKREAIEKRIFDNDLIGMDYYLSSKSRVFYKNKKRRVDIYNNYLFHHYYFDEFNEFYMNNFRKKLNKIPVAFITSYIEKSENDKNHHDYVLNLQCLAEVYYIQKNYKKMLECVLKMFCIGLNPVWKLDDLAGHDGLAVEVYDLLEFLKEELGKNRIISAYFAVWDSFNFESFVMSKYTGYLYLKNIMNGKDYNRILYELDDKFFSNDDLKVKNVVQKTLFDF